MNNKLLLLPLLALALMLPLSNAVTPTGVTYSYPFNVINTQSVATSVGFQQQLCQLPSNALVGNIVVYNSVSGATLPTWIENSTCVWTNFEGNTIGSSSSANGIYDIGYGSSGTNFLIPGNNIGINPLYGSSYGKYDNGNVVFNYYTNFTGTTLPSGWANSISYTQSNGITIPGGSGKVYYNTQDAFTGSANVLDIYGSFNTIITSGTSAAGYIDSNSTASYSVMSGLGYKSGFNWISGGFGGGFHTYAASLTGAGVMTTNSVSQASYSGSTFNGMINYNATTSIVAVGTIGTGHTEDAGFLVTTTSQNFGPFYWLRVRTSAPNGVMPTIFYPLATNPKLSVSQPTVSYPIVDVGQVQTITATITGGTANYIGNAIVTNSLPSITQTLSVPSQSGTALSSSWTVTTNEIGSETGNFVITDATANTVNSISSSAFTVYPILASVSIIPSTTQTINFGNTVSFTSSATGGATPLTYQWRSDPVSCTVSSSAINGATSNTYTTIPTGNTYYCLTVTDSATTNEVSTSPATSVTVNLNFAPPIIPTNIVAYLPIGVINLQSTAVSANTPLSVIFPSLLYQKYETKTLNNTELFYANGTVAQSWLEGNYLGEQNDANTLYQSNTVMFWFKSPATNTFLSANSVNVIYLGFAGNVPATSNMLWSLTANVGVAPQLTCSNPASTATCSAGNGVSGIYGQYDNGNNIFSFYDNFVGSSLNTNLWTNGAGGAVSNGLTVSPDFGYVYSKSTYNFNSNTLRMLDNVNGEQYATAGFSSTPTTITCLLTYGDCVDLDSKFGHFEITSTSPIGFQASSVGSTGAFHVDSLWLSGNWLTSNIAYFMQNQNLYSITSTLGALPGNYLPASIDFSVRYSGALTNVQWASIEIQPPNDIMPSSSFGSQQIPPPASINPPSNSIADVGQFETFNGIINNDASSPYTYNFIVSNTVTGTPVYSSSVSNALTSNTLTFQIPSYFTSNSPLQANVVITDAGSGVYASSYTSNIYVSTQLVATAISSPLSANILDNGQTLTIGVTPPTTGSSPYTYSWASVGTCPTFTSASTASFTYNPTSGTTTNCQFTVTVTDSATTNEVYTATTPVIFVNTALTAGTPTATNTIIDNGQYTTLTASASAGTPSYSYTWSTHSDCSSPIGGATSSSYSINPSSTTTYYYQVTDSATTPVSVCSAGKTITVNTALGTPTISPSSATYDTGQTISLTATPSGGTSPYTYQWYNYSTGSGVLMSGKTSSTLSLTAGSVASVSYYVAVTDTALSVSNSIAKSYTIHNAMTSTWTVLHSYIGEGATQTLTANAMLGTSQYTYNILLYNAIGGLVSSSLSGSTSGGNAIAFLQSSTWGIGTFTANLIIIDSATTPNTITNTLTYTVGLEIPSAGAITPASPHIDNGQSITLTSNPTGGTTPYTYQWYSGSSCSGSILGTSSTYSASPSSTTSYVYNVIDSTSTAQCSPASTITVYATPSSKVSFLNGNSILFGSNAIANDIVSGGSGSFTWTWTINGAGVSNTAVSATQTSSTYTYPPQGTYVYNVIFTDTGTTTHYIGAQASNSLVVSKNNNPNTALSFTLSPTYNYNSTQNSHLGNTAGTIYNFLSYLYTLNAISYYGINTIAVNFGANSLSSGNQITLTGSPTTASNSIWNAYQNNLITSYNAVITINDIYGDLLSNTITLATSAYAIPQESAPQLYLAPPSYSTSTYAKIQSPILATFYQESFPLSNAIIYPDGVNSITIAPSLFNTIIPNNEYQYTLYYNYPSATSAGGLTIASKVADINGYNSTTYTTSGDTVLTYNPGSVTLTTSTAYDVSLPYSFSITGGNFGMTSINIYWSDGTNSLFIYPIPQTSNTFTLYHKYTIPQTYVLTAYSTDASPNNGIISSTLTNPILVVSSYLTPSVISVSPSNRFNGANDNTENFTFYLQEGAEPLKNLTIHWNDGISSLNHNATTSFTTLTASQLTYSIIHTFLLPTAYQTNVTICDTNNICITYPTPITIGQAPSSQGALNQIYNSSAKSANQIALNTSGQVTNNDNPTLTIAVGSGIIIIAGVSIIFYWRLRKRGKK